MVTMQFPHGDFIEVIKPVAVLDEYSGEVTRWSFENAEPVTLDIRFGVAPNAQQESPVPGRNPIYSGYTLLAPIGHGIEPEDRVIVRGETYEVDGEIGDWISPFTGWRAGSVINVKRGEG